MPNELQKQMNMPESRLASLTEIDEEQCLPLIAGSKYSERREITINRSGKSVNFCHCLSQLSPVEEFTGICDLAV